MNIRSLACSLILAAVPSPIEFPEPFAMMPPLALPSAAVPATSVPTRLRRTTLFEAAAGGNSEQATWANADAEGVANRVELHTRDMTDLAFADEAWQRFGVRIWHPADRAVLDDEIWTGMKQKIQTQPKTTT